MCNDRPHPLQNSEFSISILPIEKMLFMCLSPDFLRATGNHNGDVGSFQNLTDEKENVFNAGIL